MRSFIMFCPIYKLFRKLSKMLYDLSNDSVHLIALFEHIL